MRARCGVLFALPSLTRESPFPVSEPPYEQKNLIVLSTPAILLMTTKKMIQKRATIPLMKKKVNLTTLASSTVVIDDVLGMASVDRV